ncbi:thiolase family protein [Pseudonocardia sp. N23]|uniref:thiolase family protein n=1 Tax=Pseudonocardia sp. N23 TaxID=1987376 RepID=UPI000BFE1323|nr:thiolase family protein [Pseudonocardia sp. N23]GAY07253.1 3-ketoacyl-CoA thiolase [Pseudonocardia sp. N23]
MAWIRGAGLTAFGRLPGRDALGWQASAATLAMADAGVTPRDVDGLVVGYATTLNHLMPANLLGEYLGITPQVALGAAVGGATGLAMVAQAAALVDAGAASTVLVVAGEDRASGQSTQTSTNTLAQVGHHRYEVPVGATVPQYYALLASAYLHEHGLDPRAGLAPLAVAMRAHAARHDGAQFRTPVTVGEVLSSRPVAEPLHLLDCCPISDGGAAFVVGAGGDPRDVEIAGTGQAHLHQHISEADLHGFGARVSAGRALAEAGSEIAEVDVFGIYDSFTITLALLLEELGLAEPGRAGAAAADGRFDLDGPTPVNPHGGLLSYGHCGVGGGMAHLAEVVSQLRGEAGGRQVTGARQGLVHADGGVMSAHVTAVLRGRGGTR